MAHAGAIPHELSSFGTSIDLRNTQRALALERLSEHFAMAVQGPPEGSAGSSALVPRRSAPAPRDQFGLVHQAAGAGSLTDSYHDERAQLYGDCAGLSSSEHTTFFDDPTWGYSPSCDVLAAQGRGLSGYWNSSCSRVQPGPLWYALRSTCWTFEPGSRRCKDCSLISTPSAPKCSNWSRGCLGTRADFDAPMEGAFTPGLPAFLEGQRAGALSLERKQSQKQEHSAAPA